MWLTVVLGLFAATQAASIRKEAPLLAADSPTAIEDEYIVIFDDDVEDNAVRQHHSLLNNMLTLQGSPKNKVMHHYHIGSFRGYSVHMHESILDRVRNMEEVKYVERNQVFTIDDDSSEEGPCETQRDATWGLVRTSNRDTYSDRQDYLYGDTGEGVKVYILDTGIDTKHPDFEGRAFWGEDFVDNPSPGVDEHGHGTHCAGTVMSQTWGLAKKATAIAVKVLSKYGSGSTSGIIAGVDWVAQQHSDRAKSVANMSLGGGVSEPFNDAVNAAVEAGVHFAVSAGNDRGSACNKSPASARNPVTVAASDKGDLISSFSNTGVCVDIIAPGTDVTSTWKDNGINTISGTSMAAPHVAGVMAKYLSSLEGNIPHQNMKAHLKSIATKIKDIPPDTDNDLLYYKNCD